MFLCLSFFLFPFFYSLSLYLLYSPPFSHLLLTSIFLSASSAVRFYLAIGGKLVILARRTRARETQRHHTFLHHQGKASDGRLAHCTGSGAEVGSGACFLWYLLLSSVELRSFRWGGEYSSMCASFRGRFGGWDWGKLGMIPLGVIQLPVQPRKCYISSCLFILAIIHRLIHCRSLEQFIYQKNHHKTNWPLHTELIYDKRHYVTRKYRIHSCS